MREVYARSRPNAKPPAACSPTGPSSPCRSGPGPLPARRSRGQARPRSGRMAGLPRGRGGVAPGGIDRGDDRSPTSSGAGVVEVVVVEVERLVADRVDAAAGDDLVAEDVGRADAVEARVVDRVEGGDDRRLAARRRRRAGVERVTRVGRRPRGGGRAPRGRSSRPRGSGRRGRRGGRRRAGARRRRRRPAMTAACAVGVVGGRRRRRGEEVAGLALDAALAVVERAGGDAGGPAGGEHDDVEAGGVGVGLDAADEVVAGGRSPPGRCGSGRGPAGRRCG